MPAPVIEIPVEETSAGRRIYKDEAENVFNTAFASLFNLIAAIPSGPQGERGPIGLTGAAWVVGTPRAYAEGLVCVTGNVVYRTYAASTAAFRCLQATTISNANFPSSPVSNSAWEVIVNVPNGERGLQGIQGIQGIQGVTGSSAEVVEFATDAAAMTYSTANPAAIVISTEGA